MNYLFPYDLVPTGSRVVLYGAGVVGKDFYVQIRLTNNKQGGGICLEAWVDKSFDDYDLHTPPFDYVKNVTNHTFDYIVIAVNRKNTADKIRDNLKRMNIPEEKIIWSNSYKFLGHDILPKNNEIFLKNFAFFDDIVNEYINDKSGFGGSQFYQSFKKFSLDGQRNTERRIELYNIKNLLNKKDTVLDIGCNCGFLDIQVAPYVKEVVGYEISPSLVNIANKVSKFLNINNVKFFCEDFTKNEHDEKYEAIFAFAIHVWLINDNFSEDNFVNMIHNLLAENGYLFFESNNTENFDESFQKLTKMFLAKGMKICLHESHSDTYRADIKREIIVLKKI